MKTICQYINELVPKHWEHDGRFVREEKRDKNKFHHENAFYCPGDVNMIDVNNIKFLIAQQGLKFSNAVSSFKSEVETHKFEERTEIRISIEYTINKKIKFSTFSDERFNIVWYVNLCIVTHSVLLEFFLADRNMHEDRGLEYFKLSSFGLVEKYVAPHYCVNYHKTNIVTNDFFTANPTYDIKRFIVASFR